MRIDRLFSVSMLLLAACGGGFADPDTVPTKENTARIGDAEVTAVSASADRPLAPPAYLPAWAPVFPGAELKSKVVQRQGGGVVGRGTTYSTASDFAEVVGFYDQYYREHAIAPAGTFEEGYGKIYQFDVKNGYQSMLTIQKLGGGKVDIAIAQTASS